MRDSTAAPCANTMICDDGSYNLGNNHPQSAKVPEPIGVLVLRKPELTGSGPLTAN